MTGNNWLHIPLLCTAGSTEKTREVTPVTGHYRITGPVRHSRITRPVRHSRITGPVRHSRITGPVRHSRITRPVKAMVYSVECSARESDVCPCKA